LRKRRERSPGAELRIKAETPRANAFWKLREKGPQEKKLKVREKDKGD
jgi:hypothetical protein